MSKLSLLVTISVGHVLLISAQVQSKSGLPVLQALAFDGFARLQTGSAAVADTGRSFWTGYFALRGAARENESLRRQLLDTQAQLQQERAEADKARTLEDALELKHAQPLTTLSARVIAGSPSPSSLTVTIDRGASDGVAPDMAVIGAQGVVGRVISPVSAHAATVQLLSGRNANAAVTFERSNAGGIVSGGAASPPLRAEYVPVLAEVQAGERVMTSGQDGIYPPGLPVGVVDRVTRSGADREIAVRPSVDFSHVDIVLVVLTKPARVDAVKP